MNPRRVRAALVAAALLAAAAPAAAYPEFEAFVERHSGRFVDCAMCHVNPDGPEGVKPGQIRSLDAAELERLNRARAAFEPGQGVDSPILNDFGDEIIERLGKRRFLAIRASDPAELAAALGDDSDLDGDGIPDATEYLEGTDPLDAQSGAPRRLFVHNLARSWFHIVMIVLATGCGVYGLRHLLDAAAASARAGEEPPVGGRTTP